MRERERHRGEDRGRSGQFIIIAILMIAIMIVSIGAVMYSTVTYYRYEQWEEYLSIIDNIKIGSLHLVEGGLANLTKTYSETRIMDRSILIDILDRWKAYLTKAMAEHGLAVDFLNNSRVENLVECYWYFPTSISAFSADLSITLSKFGLYGYKTPIFISVGMAVDTNYIGQGLDEIYNLNVTVYREDQTPIMGLKAGNFVVQRFDPLINDSRSVEILKATPQYGGKYMLTFTESIEEPYHKWLDVTVEDKRGITVVSATNSSAPYG